MSRRFIDPPKHIIHYARSLRSLECPASYQQVKLGTPSYEAGPSGVGRRVVRSRGARNNRTRVTPSAVASRSMVVEWARPPRSSRLMVATPTPARSARSACESPSACRALTSPGSAVPRSRLTSARRLFFTPPGSAGRRDSCPESDGRSIPKLMPRAVRFAYVGMGSSDSMVALFPK